MEENLPYTILEVYESTQQSQDEYCHCQNIKSEQIYQLDGTRSKFRFHANQQYLAHEKELDNETTENLYEDVTGSREYIEEQLK